MTVDHYTKELLMEHEEMIRALRAELAAAQAALRSAHLDIEKRARDAADLRDALAAAQAALAERTAERDDLRYRLVGMAEDRDRWQKSTYIKRDDCNAAQARAERLAEALRPFADAAQAWDSPATQLDSKGRIFGIPESGATEPDSRIMAWIRHGCIEPDVSITLGNLRAARAALAEAEGGDVADPIGNRLDPVEGQIQS